jgi:pyruvate-formate lyase-activating enzyme|tara:strand:- start:637 stop:2004 length:1368 start_codon:yes stop_codon:yes gene_type:complete
MSDKRKDILESKREQINKVSPSFCTAKWLQTTLMLQNGFNHSCHHPAAHKVPLEELAENPASLHNSKFKKKQRAKMLKGERPKECDYCWTLEDLEGDHFSDRHYKTADAWAWDRFGEIAKSDPNDDVYPAYLEISFSTACNFACAYCGPAFSSTWMADIKQNGPYPVKHGSHKLTYLKDAGQYPYDPREYNPYVEAFWKWFPEALPHLKVLRVTGGEPTMSKDMWKLLAYIIENPQPELEIGINTNMCVTPQLIDKLETTINMLKGKVKKIIVYSSVESTGEQAEYVRDGLDYELWKANTRQILENTDSTTTIMTTINMLSLPTFIEFIKMVIEIRSEHPGRNNALRMSINHLRHPPHLQCTMLDAKDRIKYADDIQEFCEGNANIYVSEIDQIQRFCNYLRNAAHPPLKHKQDFVNFIRAYDTRRNKDFARIFPEFAHLLDDWDNKNIITTVAL